MHMLDLLSLLSVPLDQWFQVDPVMERNTKKWSLDIHTNNIEQFIILYVEHWNV